MFCVAKTDELAVKTATTNKEMAQQMSNLGTADTTCLITTVMGKASQETNSLGVLLFRDALITIIWPEKNRNLACIYETLRV